MATTVLHRRPGGHDGPAGRGRLERRGDIELITLPEDKRKDAAARAEAINAADAVILGSPTRRRSRRRRWWRLGQRPTVLIDASTALGRTTEWAYGFPELDVARRVRAERSRRSASPTPAATRRPVHRADRVAGRRRRPRAVGRAGGERRSRCYSGGGNRDGASSRAASRTSRGRVLVRARPQAPARDGLLRPRAPADLPAARSARSRRGWCVSVPIHYDRDLAGRRRRRRRAEGARGARRALQGQPLRPRDAALATTRGRRRGASSAAPPAPRRAQRHQRAPGLRLRNEERRTCVVARAPRQPRLGASGAAVQNLNIALGLDEATGLAGARGYSPALRGGLLGIIEAVTCASPTPADLRPLVCSNPVRPIRPVAWCSKLRCARCRALAAAGDAAAASLRSS